MMRHLRWALAALGLAIAAAFCGLAGVAQADPPLGLSAGPRMCRAPAQAR
jgi:hypothetical protein